VCNSLRINRMGYNSSYSTDSCQGFYGNISNCPGPRAIALELGFLEWPYELAKETCTNIKSNLNS
jgi:hypothetical protein